MKFIYHLEGGMSLSGLGLQGLPIWPGPAQRKKWLMRMKLIMVLMTVFLVQASAGVFGQRLSLESGATTFKKFFSEVRKQTGYTVLYDPEVLEGKGAFKVSVRDMPLAEALKQVLSPYGLAFSLEDRAVVIREKGFLDRVVGAFAAIDVYGRVLDESGQALIGATVKVKGSGRSTMTDKEGRFVLKGVDENAMLVVVYLGYEQQEVKAGSNVEVRMRQVTADLQEVTINKGYYRTTKELNTGNVGVLKAVDIAKQPVSDPLAALSGRIAGLFIQENKGVPGRAINVQLRGQNSIANTNYPLYIVDGVPFNPVPLNAATIIGGAGSATSPLNDLNASAIEKIEVLKDADATAIYGSRGANGVILITTKKGIAGKPVVSINYYGSAGNVTRKMDMMKTPEYLEMRRKAFENDGKTPGPADYDLNGTWDKDKYTDWQELIIGGTARANVTNISVSGGGNLFTYRLGGEYRNETTVFPGDFSARKAGANISLTQRSENRKFEVLFTAGYVTNFNDLPSEDVTSLSWQVPNSPDVYDAFGNLNWANNSWTNPFAFTLQKNEESTQTLNSNITTNYEILRGLVAKINFGYNYSRMDQLNTTPSKYYNEALVPDLKAVRRSNFAERDNSSWIVEPQLNFTRRNAVSLIELLAGATLNGNKQNAFGLNSSGFSSDDLMGSPLAATTNAIAIAEKSQYKYIAFYARAGYTLKDKYTINITGRRDGSSRFGAGKQFGNFGAVGLAWLFGKESLVQNYLPFISLGKLRASIGTTGSDQLPSYEYLSSYSAYAYSYQGNPSLVTTQLANPFFAWERLNKIEAAIDLGLFNNKLNVSASWYRNRTSNQLVGYSLSNVTGFPSIRYNMPAVIQNTGIELELSTENLHNSNFTWKTSFNFSLPKNKLLSYPNIEATSYATQYKVGEPLSLRYRYVFTGINPTTRLFTFEDINKDGQITSGGDRQFIFFGQRYYGGLGNHFTYKQFTLDIFFNFVNQVAQNTIVNAVPGVMTALARGNQPAGLLNRSDIPPVTTLTSGNINSNYSLFNNSNGRFTDGSYVRLKNVSLAWIFPDRLKRALKVNGKIYFQGQNLLTFTNYKGLDPESQSAYSLPPLRVLALGMQLSL